MILLLFACAAPPAPPSLLVSAEAEPRVRLTVDGEAVSARVPVEAAGEVALEGEPLPDVAEGRVRYVEVDAEGLVVAEDWEVGVEIEPDVVLLVGEDPGAALPWLADDLSEEEPGVWRLDRLDVWAELAGLTPEAAGAVAAAVEEIVPVWIEDTSVATQAVAVAAGGRGARGGKGVRGGEEVGGAIAEEAGDAGLHGAIAGELARLRAEEGAARLAEQLPWVGLYTSTEDCLLLDLGGTFRTCSAGLGEVGGAWRVESGTLWLGDEAWNADPDGIDLGGREPLVRVTAKEVE